MTRLTLDQAQTILSAGIAKGRELGLRPVAIAVLDAGGVLKAYAQMDGMSNLRPQIAMGKANGALGLGMNSRRIEVIAKERPHFIGALTELAGAGLVPVAGGVLIRDGEGQVIGAVGVTGDTSDNDELCAFAGIEAAGLTAERG